MEYETVNKICSIFNQRVMKCTMIANMLSIDNERRQKNQQAVQSISGVISADHWGVSVSLFPSSPLPSPSS